MSTQTEDRAPGVGSKTRRRRPGTTIAVALVVIVALVVANNVAVRASSEPFVDVERVARELRDNTDELELLGGDYRSRLLGMSVEARYRILNADEPFELKIEIVKRTPLSRWRLIFMSVMPVIE